MNDRFERTNSGRKSIRSVQNLPSVEEGIQKVASQLLARGPMNRSDAVGPDGNRKSIPKRGLGEVGWRCVFPIRLFGPSCGRNLNDQLSDADHENINMETFGSFEGRFSVSTCEDAVSAERPRKPYVNSRGECKIPAKCPSLSRAVK